MPQVTPASVRRLDACTLVEWIRDCIAIAQGAEQRQDWQLYAEAIAELRAQQSMKRDCAGHQFEKACFKYLQCLVKRCLNEQKSS